MSALWYMKMHVPDTLEPQMQMAAHHGVLTGLERLGVIGEQLVRHNIETPYNGHPAVVATGNLDASIEHAVIDGAQALLRIGVGQQLAANAYALPVETGTRPHMPPSSALIPWVKLKLGVDDEKQAAGIAFAIARKIALQGTQGHEMFSRGFVDLESYAVPVLEESIAQALAEAGFGGEHA